MTSPVINSTMSQGIPVSVTTNQNTRPVSVRNAPENEIDQLNNTPNAKKIYNSRIIGGVIGGAIPLGITAWSLISAWKGFKGSKKIVPLLKNTGKAALGITSALLIGGAIKVGAKVSNALTVFFSTRGKSEVGKSEVE